MPIKFLSVLIDRRESGCLRARIVQLDAEGVVYGTNMVGNTRRLTSVMAKVEYLMRDKVDMLLWEFDDSCWLV